MPLDHLWATWRANYIDSVSDSRLTPSAAESGGRSLFERILLDEASDASKHIVWRGDRCFVLLNRYPYTSGHLMVLPNRAVGELDGLDPDEFDELWSLVRTSVRALREAFSPDGVNVGLNLGVAAGGSQSDHLHVHCVPRWVGDANYMTVAAQTRVLPISLDAAWERLRGAWPGAGSSGVGP